MRDPDPKSPNSDMPPKISDDVIRSKRGTRSNKKSKVINKPAHTTVNMIAMRMVNKGGSSAKGMEGLVYDEDGNEAGEECLDADSQNFDSRSCAESISASEKEILLLSMRW